MTDSPAAAEPEETFPLFPLGTVLFPGGLLPLQIFEPRYLDMVKRCMRDSSPFGIVFIREGREARQDGTETAPVIARVGTRARIVDFNQLPNGLLGIMVRGECRFRVLRTEEQRDRLLLGTVRSVPDLPRLPVPEEYDALVEILRQLLEHPSVNRLGIEVDWNDAASVAGRLTDLLPMIPGLKQALLEQDDPIVQLAELERIVHAMQEEADGA
ncbi:MAG: LON peptidase substrate-binding domain-containing protein [Pseudomonadales bacterium]|nr:LON peptidase substrate-binding domain-containing protein [Pseudomonadales bacterium]